MIFWKGWGFVSMEQLVAVSHLYGEDPAFVLAGGGNTSWKDDTFLYVKGSGTTLGTITAEGFVKMNRAKLGAMWSKAYPKEETAREAAVLVDLMDAREATELSKRPSVEVSLHDLFPQQFVVHTHPGLINGMTCGQNGEARAKELFGPDVIWIPLTTPGWILANTVKAQMVAYKAKTGKEAQMVILQNHGIFFAADTCEEINAMTDKVVATLKGACKRVPDFSATSFDKRKAAALAPAVRMLLWSAGDDASVVTFQANKEYDLRLKDRAAFESLSSAYNPDQIVYTGHAALWVEAKEDMEAQYAALEAAVKAFRAKSGRLPRVVCVQGLGVFAKGNTKKAADIAAEMFQDVATIAAYAESFGGHRFLPADFIDFILNWEVESYRTKVSLSGAAKKRLAGKISIVTGSAQGFGAGIAEEMLQEGSYMVVADLNGELATTNAQAWSKTFGAGTAMASVVNVAEEQSVENMLMDTVLAYGGIDVFVNNAGILKAGSLEEMDYKAFELVTKVNYSAYYLGAKYAARYMKIQNRFAPDYFMDIVQVNSKSGLVGSNKNFAYAGGKFGGIGLTQSFALELVEFNIKVNAICPGNYYGGPLWNDPEKGLFVQYLQAGKVPGAKTVEDVKQFYMDKTPIHRGCEPVDVARALFYCVEQKYETGQAIPVTGGQVMLN